MSMHTGGSLLKILGALAGSKDVDWSKWHVFFGDERNVPHRWPPLLFPKTAQPSFTRGVTTLLPSVFRPAIQSVTQPSCSSSLSSYTSPRRRSWLYVSALASKAKLDRLSNAQCSVRVSILPLQSRNVAHTLTECLVFMQLA